MNAGKTTGFLRIWKVFLFMIATIMFAVSFENTAWAAYGQIFFMDETGHVITKDQIADKTIEITYKTNGHSEGSDPEDHGEDYVWHDTVYHYPYTEGFKKTVPRSSTSYIGYASPDDLRRHGASQSHGLRFTRAWDFLSFRKKLLRAGFPLPADTASVSSFLLLGADHCAEVNNRQVQVHRRHRQELLPRL